MKIGVGDDRLTRHFVEGDVLRRQSRRGGDDQHMAHPVGIADRPLHGLHAAQTAADHRRPLPDAEPVGQTGLAAHPVLDGDDGKVRAVGLAVFRVDRGGAGGTLAAAQIIAADHEEFSGIKRFAGTDAVVPPTRLVRIGALVTTGGVMVAGKGMANQHGVAVIGVQRAISLIDEFVFRQGPAAIQGQRFFELEDLGRDQTDGIRGKVMRHKLLTVVVTSLGGSVMKNLV